MRFFAPYIGRVLALDDAGGHAMNIVDANPDGSLVVRNGWGGEE